MKNIVCIFPGQGSQYVGMANNFKDHEFFEKANSALGFDLKKICLHGPEEDLKLTENTQPAIVTHSLILLCNEFVRACHLFHHSLVRSVMYFVQFSN